MFFFLFSFFWQYQGLWTVASGHPTTLLLSRGNFCRRPSLGVRDASIYRTIIYQFKRRIHFHGPCVIYERRGIACIYQCQSDMRGAIIYSVTQIYVLKGYKTALQPSHPISQLITVSAKCARACARW